MSAVAVFVRVTVALGRIAPAGSVTVPLTAPVMMLCALSPVAANNRTANHARNFAAYRYAMFSSLSTFDFTLLTATIATQRRSPGNLRNGPLQLEASTAPSIDGCKLFRFFAQLFICAARMSRDLTACPTRSHSYANLHSDVKIRVRAASMVARRRLEPL